MVTTTHATMHAGIRAYVFNFKGKDGRAASVTFDRYGHNADQFVKYNRNQLTSNALGSIMIEYGTEWLESYTCTVIEVPAVSPKWWVGQRSEV